MQAKNDRQSLDGQPIGGIWLFGCADHSLDDDEGKKPNQGDACKHTVFFGDDGKNKIGVSIGQNRLDRAFAWAAPKQPAFSERLHGAIDLKVLKWQRTEETVKPGVDVAEVLVSQPKSDASKCNKRHRANNWQTGE